MNATGLPGGSLRSLLQGTTWQLPGMPPACPVDRYVPCYRGPHGNCLECHRLARWIVTFLATGDRMATAWNATGLPGGSLRSLLQGTAWQLPGMPPACPVDRYVPCYRGPMATAWNATGLPGALRSLLQDRVYRYVPMSVTIPRASRGHFEHGKPPTATQTVDRHVGPDNSVTATQRGLPKEVDLRGCN